MWSTAREIADGDLVILWLTRDLLQPLRIQRGAELNMRFGVYRHADLIGVPYGSKVGSRNGRGFVHVLRPTPELWTRALPHRTQILYVADIAYVVQWLDIKPGARVIEAGTGSGSFTHSVARTIGPTGHLWSYEFHESRYKKAREEFAQHGMDALVTLTHRNVCRDGFTVADTADAVFLDLPAPWEAVGHAKVALRKDRPTRICCFSPCVEQVMRTVSALNDAGFTDITMYETLLRPHQVDAQPAPLPSVRAAAAQLKQAEARREERRVRQIAQARRAAKRKRGEAEVGGEGQGEVEEGLGRGERGREGEGEAEGAVPGQSGEAEGKGKGKRARTEEREAGDGDGNDVVMSSVPASGAATPVQPLPLSQSQAVDAEVEGTAQGQGPQTMSVSKAFPEVRGHTSYLTFAVLLPPVAAATPSASSSAAVGKVEAEEENIGVEGTPDVQSTSIAKVEAED